MALAAEAAVRAWVNARPIVGEGNPLSRGAYLREQRSPAHGPYAVVTRAFDTPFQMVAEDADMVQARMQCQVYAGTEEAAEAAAAALRTEFEVLTGAPQSCGATGITVLCADNLTGPVHVPQAPDSGEIYCFQVTADFVLTG